MKRTAMIAGAVMLLTACAAQPHTIRPTYVNPALYANLSCEQLDEEIERVRFEAVVLARRQGNSANSDTALMTAGALIFWPALIGLAGTRDYADEIADLRGHEDAMIIAKERARCDLPARGEPVI
ncbi:hypothetical protein [Oceanicaulis sp.]|uniref:hypothetical protein n=1 Tax=Oceanicaulis sp. TaxID=1924941 RepID=UPI003D26CFEC